MSVVDDYFLLYHGKNAQEIKALLLDEPLPEHYPIYSLIVTIKKNSFNKIFKLKSFRELLSCIYSKEITSLDELYPLQYFILLHLQESRLYTTSVLLQDINYLKKQEIIPLENSIKLISLFENKVQIKFQKKKRDTYELKQTPNFKGKKELLLEQINSLKNIFTDTVLLESLQNIKYYVEHQKFSIGITGIINSGKSTMLNALLGEEILGSSVVPETANLTIIKYAKPQAEVFYWNRAEWNKILQAAQSINSMKQFVQETQKAFGSELHKYILEDSLSERISIDTISNYTSATKSALRCNLIKYVSLSYDLDFLKEGIEIVDTPGLDDPVVQREEITKEYLSKCDLMLHLMNVNQSATFKDIEFIIDAILYQHISKILIVITQIDSVSNEELQEVITYTKKSIKKELQKLNKSSRIEYILEHIDFIPISAKLVLLDKTQKVKSGMAELENYLQDTLFGKHSTKSELILRTSNSKLHENIQRQIHLYTYELEILSHSKEQLQEKLSLSLQNRENFIKIMSEDVKMYKEESFLHIDKLELFIEEAFLELQNITHQRLFSDISYTYKTHKTLPLQERTQVIVQTAVKDGIVDIIRDYRHEIIKKEEPLFANLEKKFIMFNTSANKVDTFLDVQTLLQKSFQNGLMTFSTDIFIAKILTSIENTKASKFEILYQILEEIIGSGLKDIKNTISQKLKIEAQKIVGELYKNILKDIRNIEDELLAQEMLINKQLHAKTDGSTTNDVELIEYIQKLKLIDAELQL